jgi:hypothetical protein
LREQAEKLARERGLDSVTKNVIDDLVIGREKK